MIKYKTIILLFIILFSFVTLYADTGSKGTAGAKFLSIGVGSRAVGMGDAFVSVANDVSALYWNPGGISFLQKNMVMLNHTDWVADINHDYFGATFNVGGQNNIGISFTFLGMPDQEVYTVQNPEGTGLKYGVSSFALGFTFARALTERFSLGVTAKYLREAIWEAEATNVGFDLGILYNVGVEDLMIGMSILNLGPTMQFQGKSLESTVDPSNWPLSKQPLDVELTSQEYNLPLNFHLGLSKRINISSDSKTIVALSLNNGNDMGETYSAGVEYSWKDISIRGGYRTGYEDVGDAAGLSFGAGYKFNIGDSFLSIVDYSYYNLGILESVNRFTFQFGF